MPSLAENQMTLNVRLAILSDFKGLASLRWLSRSTDECARQSQEYFDREFGQWFARALASGRWHIAVAVSRSGDLCGCIYLQVVEKLPVPGNSKRAWGYVTNSFVREGERRAGAGSLMLEFLIECARKLDLELLMVWPSSEAVSLYERAGFLAPEAQRTALPDEEPTFVLHLGSACGKA